MNKPSFRIFRGFRWLWQNKRQLYATIRVKKRGGKGNRLGAINTGVTTVLFMLLDYSAQDYDMGLPLSPLFDKWVWPLFILGPIVGSLLNLIPLLFIHYPRQLKEQVEADLQQRRAEAEQTADSEG